MKTERKLISYPRIVFSSLVHNAMYIFISYPKDVGTLLGYYKCAKKYMVPLIIHS